MKLEKRNIIVGIVFLLLLAFSFYFFSRKNSSFSGIELYDIKKNQTVASPLLIKGKISGDNWICFEGQVGTVELIGSDGTKLGSAVLTAASNCLASEVDFQTTLTFNSFKEDNVSLVFYNENPSGLMENNKTLLIPLKVLRGTERVSIYFGKQGDDSCTNVFAVEREIEKTEAVARAAIEELIKGPTIEEKAAGYFTGIKSNAKINKLTIVDGTAKIDFDEALEEGVGGSCLVSEIRQQIIQTLMQFETVKKVIISINGRTEDILQP